MRIVSSGRSRFERQCLQLRELVRDPRNMGALCPSSHALAQQMAQAVPLDLLDAGICVELGAGTGPVTKALLLHGVPPERLFAVEKSEALAACLAERFTGVNVLCCGAEEISGYLAGRPPVRVVVSSLPFRSLPASVCDAIMTEVAALLVPGGVFVQFTYALFGEMPFVPAEFEKLCSNVVVCNLPPAKVEVFRKPGGRGEGMAAR